MQKEVWVGHRLHHPVPLSKYHHSDTLLCLGPLSRHLWFDPTHTRDLNHQPSKKCPCRVDPCSDTSSMSPLSPRGSPPNLLERQLGTCAQFYLHLGGAECQAPFLRAETRSGMSPGWVWWALGGTLGLCSFTKDARHYWLPVIPMYSMTPSPPATADWSRSETRLKGSPSIGWPDIL
jgi:hypothetical protein